MAKKDYQAESQIDDDPPAKTEAEELEGMTVEELREYARANDINLHGASTKDEIIKEIKKAPRAAAAPRQEYTNCYQITHPYFGALRIFADSEDEAVALYLGQKSPDVRRVPESQSSKVKQELLVIEVPFVPAETEKDKPHGWPREWKTKRAG